MGKKLQRKKNSVLKRLSLHLLKIIVILVIPVVAFVYSFQLKILR